MTAKTIVICSQKGGIGKTVGTNEISANLQLAGFKTCVIDGDWMSAMTSRTFPDILPLEIDEDPHGREFRPGCANIYQMYFNSLDTAPVVLTDGRGFIGATGDLNEINNRHSDCIFDFRDKFETLRAHYDYILIDSSPAWSNVMLANHIVADYALLPTILEKSSRVGIEKHLSFIKRIRERYNPSLKFLGIFVTQAVVANYKKDIYNGRYASIDTENLHRLNEICVDAGYNEGLLLEIITHVPTKVREAIELNMTIREHAPDIQPAYQYTSLTRKIIDITSGGDHGK